jgi:hypothetical protein
MRKAATILLPPFFFGVPGLIRSSALNHHMSVLSKSCHLRKKTVSEETAFLKDSVGKVRSKVMGMSREATWKTSTTLLEQSLKSLIS